MKNKQIVFTAEVSFFDKEQKSVRLTTHAETAKELQKNISDLLSKESKFSILKLFSF